MMMCYVSIHLLYALFFRRHRGETTKVAVQPFASREKQGLQMHAADRAPSLSSITIVTLEKSLWFIRIGFWNQERRMSTVKLIGLGCGVGVIASMLGVGGGFLLVPLLVAFYHLPMRVVVSASILFAITLSAVGLFSYNVTIPLLNRSAVAPEWAWGFFTSSTAILGSWFGAKSQKYMPESVLNATLGAVTGVVGVLYVIQIFLGC